MWDSIISFLKSPDVAEILGGALLMGATLCIRRVREWLKDAPCRLGEAFSPKPHVMTCQDAEISSTIYSELNEIRTLTKAARVSIWQVHNGGRFSESFPRYSFQSSYEVLKEGVARDETVINDVSVTRCFDIFGPAIDPKLASKHSGITDITPKKDTAVDTPTVLRVDYDQLSYNKSDLKSFMDKNGNERMYVIPMFARKNSGFMGIITIQYLTNDATMNDFESCMHDVFNSTNCIQFHLDKTK